MSFNTASNTTRFFSVVGPAYVAEGHAEHPGHLAGRAEFAAVQTGVAGLWLSFFAAIGISLVNTNQAAKALQVAATTMQ